MDCLQSAICPLRLFNNIQTSMNNKLIHVLRGIGESEACYSITASFGGAECQAEEWDIRGGEDREVV